MRQLISIITEQILRQVKTDEINMVRLERFDDPLVYRAVCERLRSDRNIRVLIPKLTVEKYRQFLAENKPQWQQALTYLHQGDNPTFNAQADKAYAQKSYVDLEQAITRWRNEAPNLAPGALVLLMGTEAAPDDTGSLKDTTFVISPRELIDWLSNDYSAWFRGVLSECGIEDKEVNRAIHTLYRTIFSRVNTNLFRLSEFIDNLHAIPFSTGQELIEHICETLNVTWKIPSIINTKYVPKVSKLSKGRLSDAKIITNAIDFIERKDDIPSSSVLKKIEAKFDKFAEKNNIVENVPFPGDTQQFGSYSEFKQCVLNFMQGIDLVKNRKSLLNLDYAIIEQILGTKLPSSPAKDKPTTITGEPMDAYARMFLKAASEYHSKFSAYPTEFSVRLDKVILPDCIEDGNESQKDEHKEEAFAKVCTFLGGILDFFQSAGLEYEGESISFAYENGIDPFDFSNHMQFIDDIKGTGKWGDPGKILFTVKAQGEQGSRNYEYKWAFSPYSPWLNAYSYLRSSLFAGADSDSYSLPTMVACHNIQDYLRCESEDEFYAHLMQLDVKLLQEEHLKEINRYFANSKVHGLFTTLCRDFKDFALNMADHGLFTAMPNLRNVVNAFSDLMAEIHRDYTSFTDVQREKLGLLLNCFMITSNEDVVKNCNMAEVLLPAYHPVMLEKIDAKQIFLRDGFAEIMNQGMEAALSDDKQIAKMDNLVQLSTITHGTDVIIQRTTTYLSCKNMWEYCGVYYDEDHSSGVISGNAFSNAIVTDDEDATAMLRSTPVSGVVTRNILDYIRTFPARVDGLNVAFIAPTDMQHIVAAIHSIAKQMEKSNQAATINLRIICMNSKKNSASYLRRWLDSYFDEDRAVKVNTFLRNITVSYKADVDCLMELLDNCDICFNYNILQNKSLQFDKTGDEIIGKEQAKFPMTFTPDTIPATHGKSRKVCISQYQFLAAKSHTQANYVVSYPNSISGVYRTFMTMELTEIQNYIIEMCHKACKWVVCVDSAIDRRMLDEGESRIIGFTTGEGSYGELNVTVSARNDILADIKDLLTRRIREKFSNWGQERLHKAAEFCIDQMSKYMDGSRVLKALNPYDYEIHSFLAYILTLQMLNVAEGSDDHAVRVLISLDSYKHWFAEDEELSKDNMRPDFMLIEIPKTADNLDPNKKLQIQVKIIECKMGFQSEDHIAKAQIQLEKGIWTMSHNWDPNNESIMHRYWRNQLYRAIIFSPIMMSNTSEEYQTIRNKIYGILSGNYELEWSGDIFAFWLNSEAEIPDECVLDSDLPGELFEEGIEVGDLICHSCGQMFIQKMLVPPEERNASFMMNDIPDPQEATDDLQEEEDDDPDEHVIIVPEVGTGESIPSASVVYFPFLRFLDDKKEHTRQESLAWFAANFKINSLDQKLIYESNGHFKWETVLDSVITLFRKSNILENSTYAEFHITAHGSAFAEYAAELSAGQSFGKLLEEFQAIGVTNPNGEDGSEMVEPPVPNLDPVPDGGSIDGNGTNIDRPLSAARFLIGEDLRTKEKYYWEFGNKNLNNRHLLINGNSGCGKTYCIQTLLLEMVRSGVSGVVFDYTSGFTPDKLDPVFIKELGDRVQQRVVYLDKIPANPFAKQIIKVGGREAPESDVDVANRVANVFTTVYGFGGQQKSALYKAIKNGLKKYKEAMSFGHLEDELMDVSQKQAETVLSKIQSFLDYEPFAEEEDFDWGSIRDSDGMVYIMQLDGFDRPTQLLLTELLLWDIWNYCVKNGNEEHPFVIVLDEAQNLSHAAESPSAKFLTEGRKFGISAWYATQFMKPQLSDDEIQRLQQAGQKLYFCPPDDGVMTVAKNIDIDSQGAKEWAPKLKGLKKGECVTCGNMVRNGKWSKYDPRIIKVTSLQERLNHD